MERLTEWRDGHGALLHGDGYTKLAQYEDTGLEPGEIKSLEAEWCVCNTLLAEITHCRDCKYWRDRYIKQNDGRERPYKDGETDGLLAGYVTLDIGINMGAMCHREDNTGWGYDKSVFRNAEDFCSRGEKRPVSYEDWWGIVDGFYPENREEKAE